MRNLARIPARPLSLLVAALALGCTRMPARDTAGAGQLELDLHEWNDPTAGLPQRRRAAARRGAAAGTGAVTNPRAPTLVFRNARILTATGARHESGVLVLRGGAIQYVGPAEDAPSAESLGEHQTIDAAGRYLTPGLIDTHSHIGVYPSPEVDAHQDGNETSAPATPQARAAYAYWPQDPAITRARAGGVTTALILPGSANLVGGLGVAVVMRPARTVEEVRFPGAPASVKMACGENPKRSHGGPGGVTTRMGEYAAFRTAFQLAAEYAARHGSFARRMDLWQRQRARARELERRARERGADGRVKPEAAPEPPPRDLGLETLAGVLRGTTLVQLHCYRASDIAQMVDIADEFGWKIRSVHHALEAYKVRDLLVAHGASISTWADWWGFKMEAFDGIAENAALFAAAGGRAVIHSDSPVGIQRLNQEAAKAMYAGHQAGLEISEDQALRWITANPAWVLGIDAVTGTLEVDKRADVVLWSGHPFSVYSRPDMVVQGGEIAHDRQRGLELTDFELGNSGVSDRPAIAGPAGSATPVVATPVPAGSAAPAAGTPTGDAAPTAAPAAPAGSAAPAAPPSTRPAPRPRTGKGE
jgi:imidazolonepropionase-like amidohydrolase